MNIQQRVRDLAGVGVRNELRPIELTDEACFREAIETERPQSWIYYFPFLYCFAQRKEMTLLWEKVNASICLYMLKTSKGEQRLSLFVPPFPLDLAALQAARQRIAEYNGDSSCRIVWAEEKYDDVLRTQGFDLKPREDEYVYDTLKVNATIGSEFRRLRQLLGRCQRLPGLQLRPYQAEDEKECHSLLDRWFEMLTEDKGINVYGYGYVRSCIQNAFSFRAGSLLGEVTTHNEAIVGFTFGGPIHSAMGSLFISISDHTIEGLGYIQRHNFMRRFPELEFFNDSSDTGRAGIAHVKRQFSPVRMNRLSQALG